MDKLETVRQAGEDEVSKWTDARFGGVDVVGIRAGRDYATSKVGKDNESDPRFAPLDSRGTSLKAAVEQMAQDPEVIERVARETGNAGLLAQVTEERETIEAKKFMAANPDYYGSDENYEAIRAYLAQHNLEFREPNITRAYRSLLRSGELETAPGTPRNLTSSEKLYVISLCKAGQVDGAISQYLMYAFPDADDMWASAGDFLSDPATLPVRNEAVRFVWYQSRPVVMDTPELREFQKNFFRGRPALSLADLDACWAGFQEYRKDVTSSAVLSQLNHDAVSGDDIDDLSDAEVSDLYHRTARHITQTQPRRAGVIV